MRVGLLTFHAAHNYGSMLQAYALQTAVERLGHTCDVLNLRTPAQRWLYMPALQASHPRQALTRLLTQPRRAWAAQTKYRRFERFLRERLHCTREVRDRAAVEALVRAGGYEALVAGSDQVWNPDCLDHDRSYLLDLDVAVRRVAYAPSLGLHPETLDAARLAPMADSWRRFDHLSSREERGAGVVARLTGRAVPVVLDPTLLLGAGGFGGLDTARRVAGDYVFYYSPLDSAEAFGAVRGWLASLGCPVVFSQERDYYRLPGAVLHADCGPGEFLGLVRHARLCVGRSFHLLAFSLLYHTPFRILDPDSRTAGLLQQVGIGSGAGRGLDSAADAVPPVDFGRADAVLAGLRAQSMDYLAQSLAP